MLYIVDESVAVHFSSNATLQQDFAAIEVLTMGISDGYHGLGGSRKTLYSLAEDRRFSDRARSVFLRAMNQIAQQGCLRYSLTVVGTIFAESSRSTPEQIEHSGQREIRFPLRWFDESRKIQATVLLGENLSDANVLMIIAKSAVSISKLRYLPLSANLRGGGGSTTGNTIAQILEDMQPCLCVVDSDRACPDGQIGGTAGQVQMYKDYARFPLVSVIETAGRDLENSLPVKYYMNRYGGVHRSAQLTTLLKELAASGHHDIILHIDIDNGVTLRRIFQYPLDSKERLYWDAKLVIVCSLLSRSSGDYPCMSNAICGQNGPYCKCIIATGNHDDILNMFYKDYKDTDPFRIAELLSVEEKKEWCRLGMEVASWCYSEKKMRMQ